MIARALLSERALAELDDQGQLTLHLRDRPGQLTLTQVEVEVLRVLLASPAGWHACGLVELDLAALAESWRAARVQRLSAVDEVQP